MPVLPSTYVSLKSLVGMLLTVATVGAGFFALFFTAQKSASFISFLPESKLSRIDPAPPCDGDDCNSSSYANQSGPVPFDVTS